MTNQSMDLCNHDAEQSVLGGIILASRHGDATRITSVTGMLKAVSFYSQIHATIYRAMLDMIRKDQPIDIITLDAKLTSMGESDRTGGLAYLVELGKVVPSTANLNHYAKIVRDLAVRRYALTKVADVTELLSSPSDESLQDQLGAIHGMLAEIADFADSGTKRGLRQISDIAQGWLDSIEEIRSQPNTKTGFRFGIEELDKIIYPKNIPAGSLVVVGARPKMGKSAFLVRTLEHFADNHGAAAVFSLEMPDEQIWERYISQRSRIPAKEFYTGMSDAEWGTLDHAMRSSINLPIYIDDSPGISLAHVQAEVRKLRASGKQIGLVAVDYLTLMRGEAAERNDLAYGMVTKGLKNLAKEINGVVLLLTQLNRNLEQRSDKRPTPADSRDTGQIEQDCDMWIGLYRDDVYHDDSEYRGTIELLLRMNRHGGTGQALCGFTNGHIVDLSESVQQSMRDKAAEAEALATSNVRHLKKGGF